MWTLIARYPHRLYGLTGEVLFNVKREENVQRCLSAGDSFAIGCMICLIGLQVAELFDYHQITSEHPIDQQRTTLKLRDC